MQETSLDKAIIGAVISAIGIILIWSGVRFKDVPEDVTILKMERTEDVKRVDRLEAKVDKALEKEDAILTILQERKGDKKP